MSTRSPPRYVANVGPITVSSTIRYDHGTRWGVYPLSQTVQVSLRSVFGFDRVRLTAQRRLQERGVLPTA